MNDVTIQDMLAFLATNPDATVEQVAEMFGLKNMEAIEVLETTRRFMEYPPEYQKAAIRFWEWKNDR